MHDSSATTTARDTGPSEADDWLVAVGVSAAAATRVPVELLGEYLPMLAAAAVHGRRPQPWELDAVRQLGRLAAHQGIDAAQVVELYLSAAWRLWRHIPLVVRTRNRDKVSAATDAVLHVIHDAVGALVAGHQSARRGMIRHEEALRREFVDDLLRGDADISRMVERAAPFGIDIGKPHRVALAAPTGVDAEIDRAAVVLERTVVDRFGDRDVLVASKDGQIVLLVPGAASLHSSPRRSVDVALVVREALGRLPAGQPWRVAAGRAFPGAYGIARSYEEARESLVLAERLDVDPDAVSKNLLVYRVLARDQAALVDLVSDVLAPLGYVRGGPAALMDTLHEYFNAGEVATEAARRLHVSVRTVTYRLARVAELTGYNPAQADQRFALHTAVLGARLLDWPRQALPAAR